MLVLYLIDFLYSSPKDAIMNVLVVDSDLEMVARIKELLQEQEDIREVHGMTCFDEAMQCFRILNPEIMVIDTSLHSEHSFNFIEYVKKSSPATIIIAVSIYADALSINRIKEHGANFFLDKYLFSDNITATLNQIKKNIKSLSPV